MILHRSGIMLIGDSFSGKTTAYRMLAEIINLLANSNGEQRTSISVINPQSLTLSEFYGEYEKITHDWRDGILANNFRSYCNSNELNRRWLVFDGPVDSVWMENMNSVLDDNKKLCLMSGEILYLTPEMNLLFEISDLQKATPSIVSRLLFLGDLEKLFKYVIIIFIGQLGIKMWCGFYAIIILGLAIACEFLGEYATICYPRNA